jgi:hypothetical protein
MAARLLKIRAGVDFHPLKNIARAADEKIGDYFKKRREARAERIRNGVDTTTRTVTPGENTNPDDPAADNDNQAARDTADQANQMAQDASDPDLTVQERSAKIRARLTAGVGATALLATVCGLQAVGNEVGNVRHANVVLPLIRTGMDAITMGNQVMAGIDVDPEELGAFHEQLYDEETQTSWVEAQSIQQELGQEPTGPDMPEGSKPGAEKPGFFVAIDKFIGSIPGAGGFCGAVNTTIGGWTLSAVGIAAAATGPISALVQAASEGAQYLLFNAFLDDVVRWLAGDQVDALGASGALLGNYANYGSKLAANDIAISHGGRELTPDEEGAIQAERDDVSRAIQGQKSLYARYLDLYDPDSLAAKIMFETPAFTDPDAAKIAITRLPAKIFSSLTMPFTSLLSKNAGAAPPKYDYGFPKFGSSLEEQNTEGEKNPYERADAVEPRLAELNGKYGECFNLTVDPTTFQLITGAAKRYDQIDAKCKDGGNAELTQYRFYLADMIVAKTAACYEDIDEEACREIGFGTPIDATGTGGATIDMAKLFEDSSTVACGAGTRDLGAQGIQDGYHGGELVKIRLCAVPDIPCQNQECRQLGGGEALVNARVSGAVAAMAKAAKEDPDGAGPSQPVQLYANSSFRTMAHQRSLCPCDGVTVARPGYSNHQMGVAIDFGNGSGGAIRNGDEWFNWLMSNAATFGYKNYPRESWHWSPTGS